VSGPRRPALTTLLLTLVLVTTTAQPVDVTPTAQRLAVWWQARGIAVTVTVAPPLVLASDPCTTRGWYWDVPHEGATLYLVDAMCPVWGSYYGVAFRSAGLALVALPTPGADAVMAHEVGHLLGAADHPMGSDLMSTNLGQAYVMGLLSIGTWREIGGAEPAYAVALPMVRADREPYGAH
jgi:hypothetical protein